MQVTAGSQLGAGSTAHKSATLVPGPYPGSWGSGKLPGPSIRSPRSSFRALSTQRPVLLVSHCTSHLPWMRLSLSGRDRECTAARSELAGEKRLFPQSRAAQLQNAPRNIREWGFLSKKLRPGFQARRGGSIPQGWRRQAWSHLHSSSTFSCKFNKPQALRSSFDRSCLPQRPLLPLPGPGREP